MHALVIVDVAFRNVHARGSHLIAFSLVPTARASRVDGRPRQRAKYGPECWGTKVPRYLAKEHPKRGVQGGEAPLARVGVQSPSLMEGLGGFSLPGKQGI